MSTIVTRAGKGTPLTNNEVDANFTNLNNDKLEVEVNDLTTSVTWDNVPDAYITASSVTQHENALTITESQISDLQNYLTSYTETNDLSTAVTWDNVPDEYITESSVTQHETALTITENQITDLQNYLTQYTETDPVFSAHAASGITATNISNWNTAYNNHITAVNYTGSTLTLTQQDGGTLTTTINGALGTELSLNGDTKIEAVVGGVDVTGVITTTGHVAIGHDSPEQPLHIVDASDTVAIIESTDFNSRLELRDGTGSSFVENRGGILNLKADSANSEANSRIEFTVDGGEKVRIDSSGNITVTGTVDGRDLATDGTKLDNIEANATADQTGAEIKTAYEAESDTNAFTDAEKTKLSGIEASATADQTDAEIKTAYENNADTNAFTDADHSKLDGIEANADVTDADNVTSAGALMTTGGQMTGNITFSGTQTVDGRDLSVDGARLDTLERTARLRFQKRGYSNTSLFLTLTTSYQQVGQALRLNDATGVACEHELELNMILNYADINSSNEGFFAVTVDAPAPASETTVNLGTVITHSTSGSGYTFKVAGNVTKHMSPYCGMSVNSDGSSAFGFNNADGWFYDPQTNQTTVECYAYQANKPTTGDTVYLHPFDWETSGTEIFGDTYPLEVYNANGVVNQNQFYKIYRGYHEGGRYYKIKARETTASESLSISLMNGTYSQIIGG